MQLTEVVILVIGPIIVVGSIIALVAGILLIVDVLVDRDLRKKKVNKKTKKGKGAIQELKWNTTEARTQPFVRHYYFVF